ncbi:DUF742 domain-containing protein [Streptomyces xiamenensis]|uniref:DUF742 domain-containing protein n=1 Tax=Streptomyces TaxID=1883 RepID=UPI0004CB701B|nr:DUF742 domain-containing protein [Streptomyces sp. NRRL F-2890]
MSRPGRDEDPDRLYTLTGGRSRAGSAAAFDLVTLVVSEGEPTAGMQSEHATILRLCQFPTAVVEIAAELKLPISIVKILLCDLLDEGRITARHPRTAAVPPPGSGPGRTAMAATGTGGPAAVHAAAPLPDPHLLEQVLVGLRNL